MSETASIAATVERPEASERLATAANESKRGLVARVLFFLWAILVACPFRYWPIDDSVDNTWIFALNYAAAQGLKLGRDLVWSTGPLGYLVFPQDIGSNLAQALVFQGLLWAALIAIFADFYFRSGLGARNLGVFSLFLAMSAPLYWFNFMGLENLLLAGALMLLVRYRLGGGRLHYAGALLLLGVVPLIKLSAALLGAAALLGFLAEAVLKKRPHVASEILLAASVPVCAGALLARAFEPSWNAVLLFLRGNLEIAAGYSYAMSNQGDPFALAGAAEVLAGIGVFLFYRAKEQRATAWMLLALLAGPLLFSLKHGFVRQDQHVVNFFGFAGLALALIAATMPLGGKRAGVLVLVLVNFGLVFFENMFAQLQLDHFWSEAAGTRAPALALGALDFPAMQARLRAQTDYTPEARVEPELRAIIGDSTVSSLSPVFSGVLQEGLNLRIPPVPQSYAAYTPYLDQRNASWIRERGPRFLLFDGHAIDHRQIWAETPAMLLEVYRWYGVRKLGQRSVLLERRPEPRLGELHPERHLQVSLQAGLEFPQSGENVFWSMHCAASPWGTLERLAMRTPEVTVEAIGGGSPGPARVLLEVLGSPMPGKRLPTNLSEFASLLGETPPGPSIQRLRFGGPGLSAYQDTCEVTIWR